MNNDWTLTPKLEQWFKDNDLNVPEPCPKCKDIRVWHHSNSSLDTAPLGGGGDIIDINFCPFCGHDLQIKEMPMPEFSMSEKPLCKDCKWMVFIEDYSEPRCGHKEAKRSFINGQPDDMCEDCRSCALVQSFTGRLLGERPTCGPEGKWFGEKEVPAKEYRFECYCYFKKTPGPGMESMWIAQVSKPMQILSGPEGFPTGCAKTPAMALCQAITKAVKEES